MPEWKTIIAAAAFALAGFGAAKAMPVAPLGAADTANVIQVARICGPGFTIGPYGGCRPIGGPVAQACPRGYTRGPMGQCRIGGPKCGPGFVWRGGRCRPF